MKLVPIFLLFTSFIFAQTKSYYYPVETSLEDYYITAIEQDVFGRLVLGTDKGVFSFNGFQSKQIASSKLYSKDIIQLLKLKDKFIGLNKTGQLFEIKDDEVVLISLPEIKNPIFRLEKTKEGNLRILCSDAVYQFKMNPFSFLSKTTIPFYEKGKSELIDYCENDKGRFALLSSNELVDVNDQVSRTLPGMKGRWLMEQKNNVIIFPAKPNSNISLQYSNKRFKNLNKLIGAFNHSIQKVVRIDEKMYLLSETGMIVLKVGDMRVKSIIVGLHVTAVFQDQNKNIWLGTKSKGLYCMPAGTYRLLNSTEFSFLDVYHNEIMARSNSGEMMILNKFGNKVRNTVQKSESKPDTKQTKIQMPLILADEFVKEILPLNTGNFLVVSSKGLFSIEAKSIKDLREKLSKGKPRTVILESPVKLFQQSDSSEVLFSNLDGLFSLDLNTLQYRSIRFFNETIDPSQILFHKRSWYVLSSANKIFTIRNGKVMHEMNFRENGSNLLVSKLKIYNDQFYLLSDKTLYRTKDLNGNLERLEELSRMNDLFLRDFVVLDGKVYIATQFGLFEFKWEKVETSFPAFILGKLTGNHQKGKSNKFEASNTEVNIPYELVELMGNHPYQLQYRLVRNDEKDQTHWANTSLGLTKLTFEHLSSGSYSLELRLFDPGTGRFSNPRNTTFSIESYWYKDQLVWFIAGILIGFFGLLYLKRRKRLKKMALK
nr:two-component regulator propeller domain-containing protein [uncultured Fluviicola sp.]